MRLLMAEYDPRLLKSLLEVDKRQRKSAAKSPKWTP